MTHPPDTDAATEFWQGCRRHYQERRRMNDTAESKVPPLETWAVIELMGHIRLAGKLTEETLTQFFGGSAVFRITPCDEATARAVAANCAPAPISRYEMPKQLPQATVISGDRPGDDDHFDDDDDYDPRG